MTSMRTAAEREKPPIVQIPDDARARSGLAAIGRNRVSDHFNLPTGQRRAALQNGVVCPLDALRDRRATGDGDQPTRNGCQSKLIRVDTVHKPA